VIACMPASSEIVVNPIGDHFHGTYVPVGEPSTASEADIAFWRLGTPNIETACASA